MYLALKGFTFCGRFEGINRDLKNKQSTFGASVQKKIIPPP